MLQRERKLQDLIERYRAGGYFPDAAVCVFSGKQILTILTTGSAQEHSVFDVASLTKIATATQILLLVEEGRLSLDGRIADLLPALSPSVFQAHDQVKDITICQLLTHTSPLPAWYPFYTRQQDGFYDILAHVIQVCPKSRGVTYSDLNFMLLGKLLEEVCRLPLQDCLQQHLCIPFGIRDMTYLPGASLPDRLIPSDLGNDIEMRMVRERGLRFDGFRPLGIPAPGTVNDGNANYYFGGVSGHAGIFASVQAYARLCQVYLGTDLKGLISAQLEQPDAPGRGLGFQVGMTYPCGCGHTGFTGTSIYLSRSHDVGAVAFTNRLCAAEAGHDMSEFRRALHETVLALYGS